jgi:diadenosine tetraphosphate (Ap4A) HIT family hydrolase
MLVTGHPEEWVMCFMLCVIVEGSRPASNFYEDDVVLGSMTIGPVATGHAIWFCD